MDEKELRRYSRVVVDGTEHAPSRAMLRAVGFDDDDFQRPQIGIASTWSMVTPCNMHIDRLGRLVEEAVDRSGG
jgi:dihydroxy-acid dehydratase